MDGRAGSPEGGANAGLGGSVVTGGAGAATGGASGRDGGAAGGQGGGAESAAGGVAEDGGQAGQHAGAEAGASNGGPCEGEFGAERVLVPAVKSLVWSSPSLPMDELELFFAQRSATDPGRHVMRATRATRDADFGEPAAVSELDGVCSDTEERSVSITADGLRLYLGCYTGVGSVTPGFLHLARRPSRDVPFVVDAETYGTMGPNIDVTADELDAFSTSQENVLSPPREYRRSALDEPFGAGQPVLGLESVSFSGPHLAPDGLTLFGTVHPDLVVSTRTARGEVFGAPSVVLRGEETSVYSSPEVSADCRTLYFVRIDVMGNGLPMYEIHVATR